ncbi:MAG: hypothetical protein ACYS17_10680 [Planctomycetota bacterium]
MKRIKKAESKKPSLYYKDCAVLSILIIIDQILSFVVGGCQISPFDKTTRPIKISND